ncbi:Splicing factor 3A subunit 2 [Hondaea fermentalgiana]|uniref:Splicing factor 3A subunit 2 n=1 Tax=Hondaea fermentalgiana TaxID=2315210 RepID=A0A2R5GN56_9STRA|nr:Splicing factor 3A subunit 2 [Hondaea fermentalgiana]|eukprot:GBG32326.1 Splicing factor 3A subunit 2 [Hondaea fermentalgiana]
MDRQNRAGVKFGGGGVLSGEREKLNRKERLRRIAMETIDLNKDPYFLRNHLGTYECKLCLTLHTTEGNYLAHTQGKRHQTNLARRAARDNQESAPTDDEPTKVEIKKTIKIGRPGYKVTKLTHPESGARGLTFELVYPEIAQGLRPRHRIMSAFEQKVGPKDPAFQYLVFAAEPYETVGFRIPNSTIDRGSLHSTWDEPSTLFTLTLYFAQDSA